MAASERAQLALNAAMDRYAAGDDGAFGEIYDLLAPQLLRFFLRQVGDMSLTEDLTQQTLLQLHAARYNYVRGSSARAWAFAIGRNILTDARRRGQREVLFPTEEAQAKALGARVSRDSCPEGLAAAREMAAQVGTELEQLPESQREAYGMVRHEGLSVAETAEVMGTTPTAIKLRVHRVYEALRAVVGSGSKRPLMTR
jgi:RNA polymerase sigma-70 factor (ECF subfamily)